MQLQEGPDKINLLGLKNHFKGKVGVWIDAHGREHKSFEGYENAFINKF